MEDLKNKRLFLFDLDDTLITTKEATRLGVERAYMKLASETTSFGGLPTFDGFFSELSRIYRDSKNEKGERKYFEYDAGVFEEYCQMPGIRSLSLKHYDHSLAARLYFIFRTTKNNCLMARPYAFEVLDKLSSLGAMAYCVTQGNCNYQHTKAMITGIEEKVESVVVTQNKPQELKGFVGQLNLDKENIVMVGDSESDIQSGKNAQIDTVCIQSGKEAHSNFNVKADMAFKGLKEFLEAL